MADGEGTGEGTQTGAGTGQQAPAWLAQLPVDLKGNETFTKYPTIGDLGKAHLEVLGKVKDLDGITAKNKELETRLTNSIPKLSDKATPEEVSAYRKAMGIPEKPEGYEFPQTEGTENSPEMVAWAQKTFHRLGVPPAMAKEIGKEWNTFVSGMVEAEEKLEQEATKEAQANFEKQFKTEEEKKAGFELAKRFWNKITNTNFEEAYKDPEAWKFPLFMNFIFNAAKAIGEDWSPSGAGGGGDIKPGMIYDNTPSMKGK